MKSTRTFVLCAAVALLALTGSAQASDKTGDLFDDYGMGPQNRPSVPSDYYRREEMVTPSPVPMVPQGGMYGSPREMESPLPDDVLKPRQGEAPQYKLYEYPR